MLEASEQTAVRYRQGEQDQRAQTLAISLIYGRKARADTVNGPETPGVNGMAWPLAYFRTEGAKLNRTLKPLCDAMELTTCEKFPSSGFPVFY